MRYLRTGFLALCTALLLGVLLLVLLLYNPQFNQWLVLRLTDRVSGLSIAKVDGLLLSDMHLRDLQYQTEQIDVRILSATYRLSLGDLLSNKIQFESLHLSDVDVLLRKSHPPAEQVSETPAFIMPVQLQLDDFALHHLQIKQGESVYLIDHIKLDLFYYKQQILLRRFALDSDIIQLAGDAELQLGSQLPFTADLTLAKSVPDLAEITAQIKLQGDRQKVNLAVKMLTPAEVNAQGWIAFSEESPRFDVSGSWSQLQWPMQGEKQYASENARLSVRGSVADYVIKLESDIFVEKLAAGKLNLLGRGDAEQFTLNNLTLNALTGKIHSKGRISWTDSIASELQLTANNLQLPPELTGIPAEINLQAQLSGRLFNEPDFRLKLSKLFGRVLDKPVRASANFHYTTTETVIEPFKATVGDNTLLIQGSIGSNNALDFTLDAADLRQLSPYVDGAAYAEGRVRGSMEQPEIKFELLSNGLVFQQGREQLRVGGLLLKGDIRTAGKGRLDLTLNAGQSFMNGLEINKLEFQSRGDFVQHQVTAIANSQQGDVKVALQGRWNPVDKSWLGQIEQFKFEGTSAGVWQIIKAAPLQVQRDKQERVQLQTDFCLTQSSHTGLLCLSAKKDQVRGQMLKGGINQLAVSTFADWLPTGLQLDSYLQAEFSFFSEPEWQGDFKINLAPGSVKMQHEQTTEQIVSFQAAQFEASLLAGDLQSDLAIDINDKNHIKGALNLSGLTDKASAKIDGLLNIKLESIGFLGAFIESVDSISGTVDAQLALQGLLAEPSLYGSKLQLRQGALTVPELGLSIENINVGLNHTEQQQLVVHVTAAISEQSLSIDGLIDQYLSEQFKFQMAITGEKLQVVQLPEMQIWISPDLHLTGDKSGAMLQGELTIPEAQLIIENLPAGAVAVSDDEVDVSVKKAEPKAVAYPLDADIQIRLGDSVSLEGFGLKTSLQGQLRAIQKKNQLKLYNELNSVKGTYQAYGQDLTIEKGQLLFNGGMENPGINILASRKASDWEDKTIAYLRMTGTLKNPLTTVYTEPALSESDALAYLLTGAALGESDGSHATLLATAAMGLGRDYIDALMGVIGIDEFDMKSTSLGQNSMVIGKRLSSDLYARYIMDVLTSEMQFSVIYKLTKNISIETRAGTTHSSDIKYNIEFD